MDWQPISSAPKDGTPLIGWFGNASHPHAESIYWSSFMEEGVDIGTWVWQQDGDSPQTPPTHWIALNPPNVEVTG